MIKDAEYVRRFEADLISEQKISYEDAMKIFEAMWEEAVSLGILPAKEPLEGIESDIKIARILNSCLKNS